MAVKEVAQAVVADALEFKEQDLKQGLLLAGWPQSLIDEYMLKNQRKFHKLEIRPESALVMLNSISKKFGKNVILEDLSLQIVPGELFGIIGLSGAGKTTLLNLLVGFSKPDSGNVTLKLPDGSITSIDKDSSLVKAMFGFAAQTPSFYSKLTVKENLEHFGALYGITEAELIPKIKELLRFVGLEKSENAAAINLSGGMQKRLDIACALIHEPKLLILDEPTADLDPMLRKQMWALIKKINKTGTTVIVASHFVNEIEDNCQRIAVLGNKKIFQIGTPEQLITSYAKNYEVELVTDNKDYALMTKSLRRLKSVNEFVEKDDTLVIYTDYPDRLLAWIAKYCQSNKEQIKKLNLARPSLSEVFESIVTIK
ncbi:ABC transporter ATP-binding protein [Candidatus Woesearchaeota archaeon]|nr:ABC transporter ATP-binding protein [Candidatus Woesearchaeota archaeon]MBW2993807.1 ABC transporter ATP-binding protein [Candidatus Woesearchaeota archaeon]